jgi:hypothetical protein
MKRVPVMLSVAKHLLFLVENKEKQIPRADYSKVFEWRSAPRFARDDNRRAFLISLIAY